jgi:tetratricopeptide (TPR) repeat protein
MFLTLALLLQDAAPKPGAEPARYTKCMDLATGNDPAAGRDDAALWRAQGGDFLASQCLGVAYANQEKWATAAAAFEEAAAGAGAKKDARAATYWAQAGNAWLAAGERAKARAALDAALATGRLEGFDRGEALLDRARAIGPEDAPAARRDLDQALILVPADPLGWLLSATLARRAGDLPRAKKDIAEALRRSADDASVQVEAGNIAAAAGDEAGARAAWGEAVRLGRDKPAGRQAAAALAQFAAGATTPPAR